MQSRRREEGLLQVLLRWEFLEDGESKFSAVQKTEVVHLFQSSLVYCEFPNDSRQFESRPTSQSWSRRKTEQACLIFILPRLRRSMNHNHNAI